MITNTDTEFFAPLIEYLKAVPFDVSRKKLYNAADLYEGYDPQKPETFETCFDTCVYKHFMSKGKITSDIKESVARISHDHRMYIALGEFFRVHNFLNFVGVMGGHTLLRTDEMYRQIVFLSKRLTELGFFMLSGGGPGAMEATHLGAWMAGYSDKDVEDALKIVSDAPSFRDCEWLRTAFEVMRKYPQEKYESLGIPTWLYGHEPPTPLATHVAKFFDNSIRENAVLTLSFGGIIYTPGSAGTIQEIFQNAVQNHYLSLGFSSPMIFLGENFWTNEVPIYPLLQHMEKNGLYKNLNLSLTDDFEEIMQTLVDFQENAKAHPEEYTLR